MPDGLTTGYPGVSQNEKFLFANQCVETGVAYFAEHAKPLAAMGCIGGAGQYFIPFYGIMTGQARRHSYYCAYTGTRCRESGH